MSFSAAKLTTMPTLRHHRRLAREKFRKLLRLMRYSREIDLRVVYVCRHCGAPVALKLGEGLIEVDASKTPINEKTDAFSLACRCTVWTVGK